MAWELEADLEAAGDKAGAALARLLVALNDHILGRIVDATGAWALADAEMGRLGHRFQRANLAGIVALLSGFDGDLHRIDSSVALAEELLAEVAEAAEVDPAML